MDKDPNGHKIGFSKRLRKICLYFFLELTYTTNLKILCFPVQTLYLEKVLFTSYRPKCCGLIRFQDPLIINISEKNWFEVFCLEILTKKVASDTFTFGWGVIKHAQLSSNLPREFFWLVLGILPD